MGLIAMVIFRTTMLFDTSRNQLTAKCSSMLFRINSERLFSSFVVFYDNAV